jgi:hypothetical protein
MLSCLVVSYTQRPSGFKAIIKSIFKTNLPSLMSGQEHVNFFGILWYIHLYSSNSASDLNIHKNIKAENVRIFECMFLNVQKIIECIF